jgi:glycosyltransferase involved in cell wall biosynthesis
MPVKLAAHNKTSIIPCGVNIDIFQPIDKLEARKILGLIPDERIVLFSSEFDVPVKNYPLAKAACAKFDNIKLIELKNFTREQVNLLLNACDLLLLTSIREGSPQVVKEAMACNCPIVSTDVGDVRNNIQDLQGCYIASFDPVDVAEKIKLAFNADRTGGRKRLIDLGLDSVSTALRIIELYKNILKSNY